jgi:hypothetical protein
MVNNPNENFMGSNAMPCMILHKVGLMSCKIKIKSNTKEIFAIINARNYAMDEYCFFGFPMLWV